MNIRGKNVQRVVCVALVIATVLSLAISAVANPNNRVTRDGITAQLVTDKDSYTASELINAFVNIENNSGGTVSFTTTINAPDGVTLGNGNNQYTGIVKNGDTWTTPIYNEDGRIVPIEAEDASLSDAVKMESHWGAVGGSRIVLNTGSATQPKVTDKAAISFEFAPEKDDEFYLWARVYVTEDTQDNVWLSINGTEYTETSLVNTYSNPADEASYVWAQIGTFSGKVGQNTVVKLIAKETGARIDRFAITDNVIYKAENEPYLTKKGSVIIEAEQTTLGTQHYDNSGNAYVIVEDVENAVGKSVMLNANLAKDTSSATSLMGTHDAGIGFDVVADTAGTYYIWVRAVVMNDNQRNKFISIAGDNYRVGYLSAKETFSKNETDYIWYKITSFEAEEGTTTSVRLAPRKRYGTIDRFIVTTNAAYVPEGEGKRPPVFGEEVLPLPSGVYPSPEVYPTKGEHPRVLFRASDIPTIKANLSAEENQNAYKEFLKKASNPFNGMLPQKYDTGEPAALIPNFDAAKLGIIEAKAFDYVINGNVENGHAAIAAIKNYINTSVYSADIAVMTREAGTIMFTAAEVYDWCYDLLTDDDKLKIVATLQGVAAGMETGYPPSGYMTSGHGAETCIQRDWLSFAIATYDEYPDIYEYIAGMYYSECVSFREFMYTSEAQTQGSAYGVTRYNYDLWGQWLIYRMSGVDPLGDIAEHASQIAYQWIYTRRPDGQLLRDGDDFSERSAKKGLRWVRADRMLFFASNFYKDPYLKKEFLRENPGISTFTYSNTDCLTAVQVLALNDPTLDTKSASIEQHPRTKYFPEPLGAMVARTGWDMGIESSDVLVYMKIKEVSSANHDHEDAGTFQIYYKGILASESGLYDSYSTDHSKLYYQSSISHNTLSITSSQNPTGVQTPITGVKKNLDIWLSDGKYNVGEVLGHEFGPNIYTPEYTYLSGDIADAYNTDTDQNVQEALRSMLFLPLDNEEYPAAFIVFDKITTTESGSTKSFLLHSETEPTVNGNISVIVNAEDGYNGMLTNQTLLPKNPSITKIGGTDQEFVVGGINYPYDYNLPDTSAAEPGWGRIEISTTTTAENQTDYFLNVMYVNDADGNVSFEQAELIEADQVLGAKIFNRVAMFNKDKERTAKTVSFTIPADADVAEYKVCVAGLKAGTWTVTVNGQVADTQIASEDGGVIYFAAAAGACELTYTGTNSDKTFDETAPVAGEGIDIRLNGNLLYTTVKPTLVGEEVLVPMRTIFEKLGAQITWDDENGVVVVNYLDRNIVIDIKANTVTVNGQLTENISISRIVDDEMLIPVSTVNAMLGDLYGTASWDPLGALVSIKATVKKDTFDWSKIYVDSIPVYLAIEGAGGSDTNSIWDSVDGVLTTYWGASSTSPYGIYDFGEVYTLEKVMIAYHQGQSRNYLFDIEVSLDGINYTHVFSGESAGFTNQFESFNIGSVQARYVRYTGKGHIVTATGVSGEFNSIREIVFLGEKGEVGNTSAGDETKKGPGVGVIIAIILIVLALACGGVCVFLIYRKKHNVLHILLLGVLLAGVVTLVAMPAEAADKTGVIELSHTIQVDGKDVVLTAKVEYVILPEEPSSNTGGSTGNAPVIVEGDWNTEGVGVTNGDKKLTLSGSDASGAYSMSYNGGSNMKNYEFKASITDVNKSVKFVDFTFGNVVISVWRSNNKQLQVKVGETKLTDGPTITGTPNAFDITVKVENGMLKCTIVAGGKTYTYQVAQGVSKGNICIGFRNNSSIAAGTNGGEVKISSITIEDFSGPACEHVYADGFCTICNEPDPNFNAGGNDAGGNEGGAPVIVESDWNTEGMGVTNGNGELTLSGSDVSGAYSMSYKAGSNMKNYEFKASITDVNKTAKFVDFTFGNVVISVWRSNNKQLQVKVGETKLTDGPTITGTPNAFDIAVKVENGMLNCTIVTGGKTYTYQVAQGVTKGDISIGFRNNSSIAAGTNGGEVKISSITIEDFSGPACEHVYADGFCTICNEPDPNFNAGGNDAGGNEGGAPVIVESDWNTEGIGVTNGAGELTLSGSDANGAYSMSYKAGSELENYEFRASITDVNKTAKFVDFTFGNVTISVWRSSGKQLQVKVGETKLTDGPTITGTPNAFDIAVKVENGMLNCTIVTGGKTYTYQVAQGVTKGDISIGFRNNSAIAAGTDGGEVKISSITVSSTQ